MPTSPALPCPIVPKAERFSHEDAHAISKWVLRRESARNVIIDLSSATDATTAAFATLVVLRRQLLRVGRDMRLAGLRERAQFVYDIARLSDVLPQQS
jgi:anti-anti-sigma regulatory factor